MAEIVLAERGPLAHCVTPGRHGRMDGEAGVTLRVLHGMRLTLLLGRHADAEGLAAATGAALPAPGKTATAGSVTILWAGPDQWLVAAEPEHAAAAERFVQACRASCTPVDQSDGRAVVEISGPMARPTLAKGVPIDLHPRLFQPGATALTIAAAVAVQIWQVDDAPTYRIAVPRSFAEAFWRWLVDAAAEYGVVTESAD